MIAYLLNLVDLFFTLHAIQHGGVELNPFMQSVPIMVMYKVIVVGALLLWLKKRPERSANIGLKIITAVYAVLDCYHLYFIFLKGMI